MVERGPLRAPTPRPGVRPTSEPRLSVIVPAYNAAATIGEALDSTLGQLSSRDEVIVSDDGSRDDLARALKPFERHIRLVQGPNVGLAGARNRAAAVAAGQLLAMLDADDVWLPGRADALRWAAASRPDLTVLTTDAIESWAGVVSEGTYYETRDFVSTGQVAAILRDNFIFGAGAVRTEAFRSVGGYREGTRHAEDWDLWVRLLLAGHSAGLVDQPLYEYRRRPDSLTGDKVELAVGVLDLLERWRGAGLDAEQARQVQLTRQRWRERAADDARRNGDRRARALSFRAAVGLRATPRARVRYLATTVLRRRPSVLDVERA